MQQEWTGDIWYEAIYGRSVRELFAGQYQQIERDVVVRAKILAHRKEQRPNQKKTSGAYTTDPPPCEARHLINHTMNQTLIKNSRVLAVALSSRGLGYLTMNPASLETTLKELRLAGRF